MIIKNRSSWAVLLFCGYLYNYMQAQANAFRKKDH